MGDYMQKIKLLKLYEYLRKETDESHPISRRNLCQTLNDMGISSNVRTLSKDIETLRDNGFEIMSYLKEKEKFYYVADREITTPEIKIIIDAIHASRFITAKKSAELIDKIAAFASRYQADILKKNMLIFNTHKHSNESVLYNVDSIEDAIARKKKISFNYFHLNEDSKRKYVSMPNGRKKKYIVEPVALIFNEDNYYLMGYLSRHPEGTANYRIDRMDHVNVIEDSKISDEALAKINGVRDYNEQVFKMFGGKISKVTLQFDKDLVEPVFDKFGEEIKTKKVDDNSVKTTVSIQVSPTFFGWLAQFGGRMKIIAPASVNAKFRKHLKSILEQ